MIVASTADSPNGVLRGRLLDSVEHASINTAYILVHSHGSESDGAKLHVDHNGDFSAKLPPGFYDVFISSRGFSPVCRQVAVEAGRTVVYNAELKMSEIVNTSN